jgi:hypothetical protein
MDISTLDKQLDEIDKAIGVKDKLKVLNMVIDAQEFALQIQRDSIRSFRQWKHSTDGASHTFRAMGA